MIPIRDDNPAAKPPLITVTFIALCSLVFLWQQTLTQDAQQTLVMTLGAIPAVLIGDKSLPAGLQQLPAVATIFTSMFLHGGWMHLLSNMLYLWIFGDNIEGYLGHLKFLFFYLVCGIAALLAHVFIGGAADVPLVGASGAISGILGAYMVKYPRARVLVIIPIVFFWSIRHIPALIVLGFWFVIQVFSGVLAAGQGGGGVAFWAHVGGFVAGLLLIKLMPAKKRPASFWN